LYKGGALIIFDEKLRGMKLLLLSDARASPGASTKRQLLGSVKPVLVSRLRIARCREFDL
jgi:hypothetical protein